MGGCGSIDKDGAKNMNKRDTTDNHKSNVNDRSAHEPRGGILAVDEGTSNPSDDSPAPQNVRMQNIFSAPVDLTHSFHAPFFEKSEEDEEFIRACLKSNFIFSTVPQENLPPLIGAFERLSVESGTAIIVEGETGDYFYIIKTGEVEFTIEDKKVGDANQGKSFGGLALLYNAPRAATCMAKVDCELWRVDQHSFRHIQANYAAKEGMNTKQLLREVPFLADLDEEYISKLAYGMTAESYAAGEMIAKKGEVGNKFFIVKTGKVVIRDIEAGGKKFADSIGETYFGERALIKDEPRAGTILALEDTELFSISKDIFMGLLGNLSDLIIKTNDVRKLKGMKAFSRSKVGDSEYKNLITLIKDVSYSVVDKPIFTEGETIEGALYIVRTGKVTVTSTTEETKVLTPGGIFGEAYIHTPTSVAQGTASINEDCTLGRLLEKDIYSVLRSRKRLHNPFARADSEQIQKVIRYVDLKKHRLLGVGTFGKVWLVTEKSAAHPEAFALKVQRKRQLLDHKQIDGALREMNIMKMLDHPFIVKMHAAYQDQHTIMILLRLVQGGELFSLMKRSKKGRLGEDAARFYAAGILEGLTHMHHRQILYRDLKPENVLIDKDGFPVIVDLGFAKIVPEKTYTLCGTPWYIAPEVILGRGHNNACDYWSLCVMVHEMICGITPFNDYGTDQMTLFKAIVNGKFKVSRMGTYAVDYINRTLVTKPSHRLGSLAGGDMDIKTHMYFKCVDYDQIIQKDCQVPWQPKLKDAFDVSDFDNWDHMEKDEKERPLTKNELKRFVGFNDICM